MAHNRAVISYLKAIIKKYGEVGTQQIMAELENSPTQRVIQKDLVKLKQLGMTVQIFIESADK